MTGQCPEPLLKLEHPILFTGEWAFSELYVEYRGKEGNFADSSWISPGARTKKGQRDKLQRKYKDHCQHNSQIWNTSYTTFQNDKHLPTVQINVQFT